MQLKQARLSQWWISMNAYRTSIASCMVFMCISTQGLSVQRFSFVAGVGIPGLCVIGDDIREVKKRIRREWHKEGMPISPFTQRLSCFGDNLQDKDMCVLSNATGGKIVAIIFNVSRSETPWSAGLLAKGRLMLCSSTSPEDVMAAYGKPRSKYGKWEERKPYFWEPHSRDLPREVPRVSYLVYPSIGTRFIFVEKRLRYVSVGSHEADHEELYRMVQYRDE